MADKSELELPKALYRELQRHKRVAGIAATMGMTCTCGYWTGEEKPGITQPIGVEDLDWHRAKVLSSQFNMAAKNVLPDLI
jgi:hypothetical protein